MGTTQLDVCRDVCPELSWKADYRREGSCRVGVLEDLEVSLHGVPRAAEGEKPSYEVRWKDSRKRSGTARHPTMRGALEFVRYGLQGDV